MTNLMKYKGYLGTIESSDEDDVLFGQLVGIKDLVSYEGSSLQEINERFEEAVDHYLDVCIANELEPNITSNEKLQKDIRRILEKWLKNYIAM